MPTFVSPLAHRVVDGRAITALDSFDDLTLGLLHNSKPNAALLLDALATAIGRRIRLAGVVRDSKVAPTSAAPAHVYANLASRCGAVLFASAT